MHRRVGVGGQLPVHVRRDADGQAEHQEDHHGGGRQGVLRRRHIKKYLGRGLPPVSIWLVELKEVIPVATIQAMKCVEFIDANTHLLLSLGKTSPPSG